ncbi:MAG TPA: hypothetical protein VI959_01505 [Alphaproteobacteria bacterium]|nr:hypothetical protein [Alphaproteobacteria bacterium]
MKVLKILVLAFSVCFMPPQEANASTLKSASSAVHKTKKVGKKINCQFAYTANSIKNKDFTAAQKTYVKAMHPEKGECKSKSNQEFTSNFRKAMCSKILYNKKPFKHKGKFETSGFLYDHDATISKCLSSASKKHVVGIKEVDSSRVFFVKEQAATKFLKSLNGKAKDSYELFDEENEKSKTIKKQASKAPVEEDEEAEEGNYESEDDEDSQQEDDDAQVCKDFLNPSNATDHETVNYCKNVLGKGFEIAKKGKEYFLKKGKN